MAMHGILAIARRKRTVWSKRSKCARDKNRPAGEQQSDAGLLLLHHTHGIAIILA